ncbi:hypothetical protein OG453_07700 [Streptomyces sp. NBC_01381]|uniref:hypothetical protein n=1 Tax=Streptomyces sp. NBC_01381 TaxID=2903845 RepID=UPI002254B068|nr:hypothetical protein [Streptomyces sp. NBC_01381]MCX4666554.1 hypothetical protein [Streptomyces sp. NBC_01381]
MHARFEPLPVPHGNQDAYDTAAELREHLGEWALIDNRGNLNRATNLSYRIRTGRHAAFRPAGAFEARARTAEDGSADVYARYIGTPTSSPRKRSA